MRTFFLLTSIFISVQAYSQSKFDYPIYFAYKSAVMDTTEEIRLRFFLKNFDSITIDSVSIKGYCDDRGKKKINETLAKKRAETIFNFISSRIKHPFPSEIKSIGSLPLGGDLKIENQRTLNRRGELEIFYSMTKKKSSPSKAKTSSPPNSLIPKKALIPDTIPDIKSFLQSAKVGETIDLKIFFVGGSSELLKSSLNELQQLLQIMKENTTRKIKITGHIHRSNLKEGEDGFDYKSRNNSLSANRAKSVYTFLVNNKIERERLASEGMSSKFPKNKMPEDDRRVEIVVVN